MSAVSNIDVKRCPCCNGKSKLYKYLSAYYVKCIKCKLTSAPYDTPELAQAAWNMRACEVIDNDKT